MKMHRFVRSLCAGVLAAGGAAGIVSSCSGEPVPVYFDGKSLGYCSEFQVAEIGAAECAGARCGGSVAYALCNGASYTECACEIPNGYEIDGGALDGPQGPPAQGVVGFNGGGPAGVALPCCQGNDVFEIPSPECDASCVGSVAYAVCQNNSYSGCSCDIPDGFGYPDGPGPCDAN
jgi:hypothetical protein